MGAVKPWSKDGVGHLLIFSKVIVSCFFVNSINKELLLSSDIGIGPLSVINPILIGI